MIKSTTIKPPLRPPSCRNCKYFIETTYNEWKPIGVCKLFMFLETNDNVCIEEARYNKTLCGIDGKYHEKKENNLK